ncbi:hypothetical protein OAT16_11650 [Prolixibacteraceae bacterium]|nr:hypothetical protein [Prolixibacteraceae bacterium]
MDCEYLRMVFENHYYSYTYYMDRKALVELIDLLEYIEKTFLPVFPGNEQFFDYVTDYGLSVGVHFKYKLNRPNASYWEVYFGTAIFLKEEDIKRLKELLLKGLPLV